MLDKVFVKYVYIFEYIHMYMKKWMYDIIYKV